MHRNKLKDHPGFGRLFRGLYLTIFFITLRNVYRLAEFAQQAALSFPEPDNTFILAHSQALFYCLDALPILLAFLTFIVYHPSRLMFGHDAPLPPTDVESPTVTTETEVTVDGAKTP